MRGVEGVDGSDVGNAYSVGVREREREGGGREGGGGGEQEQ